MKNLAGIKDADVYIKKELEEASIPIIRGSRSSGEVPYSITGKLSDWNFERAWYYWVCSASDGKGLPLDVATELHERKYPIIGEDEPKTYGKVIRVTGHCGCPHPRKWANHYDALGKLLQHDPRGQEQRFVKKALSEGTFTQEQIDAYHFVRTVKELKEQSVKALIDLYHIDTQIGLNEFARVIRGR